MRGRKEIKPTGVFDRCNYCEEDKDIAELVKSSRNKKGYINYCLPCKREYNGTYIRKATVRGGKIRAMVGEYKDKPCMDCGEEYPRFVMDLDHVRGEKKFILSQAFNYPVADVLSELAKCDVVCANCHRFRTFTRT